MIELTMPRLSDSMEEGTVLTWFKQVGDPLEAGEDLAEIESDKANMVFPSDAGGTLGAILVSPGETVAVGQPIALLLEAGEQLSDAGDEAIVTSTEPRSSAAESPVVEVGSARVRGPVASPVARRIAAENGIDLGALVGSGRSGRILKADVVAVVASQAAPDLEPVVSVPESARGQVEVEQLSAVQAKIARRMAESKVTAPHFYLEAEVDMTAAVAARIRLREAHPDGVVPSLNDLVIKACALALRAHPRANGTYRHDGFEIPSRVNVGVAVAVPGSLLVPTIFDADRLGLGEIATRTRELAKRGREGTITASELAGGTFTVSNLGMYGIRRFSAIVNPPQAAILAVGEVVERPVLRDGSLAALQSMIVTLSCDHRILYGAEAAAFLASIRAHLEEPLALAL
jgi:pyruvate dehydrogenase E2 component (dihydrolipoamide acetyltransferase)